MFDLNDPDMREIVIDFCDECDALTNELEDCLDKFEDEEEPQNLEQYGQIVDRMMGAAQTLGITDLGQLCKMGKIIGYKSSQCEELELQNVSSGILFDLTDLLKALILELRDPTQKNNINVEAFLGRLKWLGEKLQHIKRSSCSFEGDSDSHEKSDDHIDHLIENFSDKKTD